VLTLSQRERDRLVVLRQVAEGRLKVAEGARRLGIGTRQMRRQVRRYEAEGDGSVIHALRSRPSNRRLDGELRRKALEKAGEPLYRDFGPTLLSEHLERDESIGVVHPSTLRRWMIEAGLWTARKRRKQHRRRRERRAACGELVLMDTSIHAWLEERSAEEIVLIALIDDATSRLCCRFFPRDTGAANRQLLIEYMARHGRMGAVYADRAGHFQMSLRRKERQEKDLDEAITLIRRGLNALDIELILALSPQAKGRVERLFGTLQDRLIKEMRVKGIASMEQANRFLEEEFIPFWDARFGVAPRESVDAHRELPRGVDLLRLFAETKERVIGNDFSFRYRNRFYQIEDHEADGAMPKSRITIEERLDGTLRFRWRERYLLPTPLLGAPLKPEQPRAVKPVGPRPLTGAAGKPIPPDHPWRRFPNRVGKARFTSPAARATLPTPQTSGDHIIT
jgi:transposase-like protein